MRFGVWLDNLRMAAGFIPLEYFKMSTAYFLILLLREVIVFAGVQNHHTTVRSHTAK